MLGRNLFVAAALLASPIASAGTAINTDQGVAIGGYDPVAYVTKKAAAKGDAQYSHEWAGAKWIFSSAEHRDLFAATPEKFAPQYGGHCAYAVGARGTISSKPATGEHWTVHQGRIYLFPDAQSMGAWYGKGPGTMTSWGDQAWPALKARLEAR